MSENNLAKTGCAPRGLRGFFGGLLFFPVFFGGLESGLFDSDPEHTLRVVQSIGILLPLFAGLLRFATNDQSDVSEQVNGYLLLGILGLVFGGLFATLAAMVSDVTGILKVALFFVCLTFIVIGGAAIIMFRQIPRSVDRVTSSKGQNGVNDEGVPMQSSEATTDDSESDDSEDQNDQIENEIDSKAESRPTEQTVESTESDSANVESQ